MKFMIRYLKSWNIRWGRFFSANAQALCRDRVNYFTGVALLGWLALGPALMAQTNSPAPLTNNSANSIGQLKKMSLEDLLTVDVSIVSRAPEKLVVAPSSVQVVTAEDIHRSGAMSLPEALRLAPNLEVAQVNSHDWAISARGFNNSLANKLLVMIDGRTVYTPLDAGVFWDAQSVLLEDIDRIEVVSGPGGSVWGANAVNGVINIVSKSAKDTQGLYLSSAAGSQLQDYGAIRYGGSAGTNLFYRVYVQRSDTDSTQNPQGNSATNAWDMTQGGFRMDWYPTDGNTLTLQGDFYSAGEQQPGGTNNVLDGENILGRWTHVFSPDSDMSLQLYWDRTWRDGFGATGQTFTDKLNTFDIDFQHHFALGSRDSLVWGWGYRLMEDHTEPGVLAFQPANLSLQLYSAFVQNEVVLVPDRLKWTVGTKLEHNDYTGFEIEPSTRLAWTPNSWQTVWGAVSRSVRTPSRIDSDLIQTTGANVLLGQTGFLSESELSYEVGYRAQPATNLSLSLSGYYNSYRNLRSLNAVTPNTQVVGNNFLGETAGLELSAEYQATDWWRLRGGYNYLVKDLWSDGTPAAAQSVRQGSDPRNQLFWQSIMNLPGNIQFDLVGRYVTSLEDSTTPGYATFDARLAWQCHKNCEISLVGQNLCGTHVESGNQDAPNTQRIAPSVYGRLTLRF